MLPRFVQDIDAGAIFVQAPSAVIFLCGGKISLTQRGRPQSLRDAFLRIPDNPATEGRTVMLAEQVNAFYLARPAYPDLLRFETDFAQICELILLFSESQGSIAELGAFSMVPEIASRSMIVVRSAHADDKSFIRLGPLLHLTNAHGPEAVFVIDDDDVGIVGGKAGHVDLEVLRDLLRPAIDLRMSSVGERRTFDPSRSGHFIKLVVGLIQEYGGLSIPELREMLVVLGHVKGDDEIDRWLLCAEAVGWIAREQRGFEFYFFARPVADALHVKWAGDPSMKNRARRRAEIREHWKATDAPRYRGIVKFAEDRA